MLSYLWYHDIHECKKKSQKCMLGIQNRRGCELWDIINWKLRNSFKLGICKVFHKIPCERFAYRPLLLFEAWTFKIQP